MRQSSTSSAILGKPPTPLYSPLSCKLYMVVRSADESHISKQDGSSWEPDVTSRSIEEASIQIIIMAQIFDVISWCSLCSLPGLCPLLAHKNLFLCKLKYIQKINTTLLGACPGIRFELDSMLQVFSNLPMPSRASSLMDRSPAGMRISAGREFCVFCVQVCSSNHILQKRSP